MRALIYINETDNDIVNKMMVEFLSLYCRMKGYQIVGVYTENTNRTGVSDAFCFTTIGLGVTDNVDIVVTLFKRMVGDSNKAILRVLRDLADYGVAVETVKNDLEAYYESLLEVECDTAYLTSDDLLLRFEDFFNAGE